MMVAAERQSTIYFTGMKSEIIQNKVAKLVTVKEDGMKLK